MSIMAIPVADLAATAVRAGVIAARVGWFLVRHHRVLRGRANVGEVGSDLTELLTSLGPTYIKIGQLLSTRRDLIPEEVCRSLGRLVDSTPPPPNFVIVRALSAAFPTGVPFDDFEPTPIATGSIATVHRAQLNGEQIAVKLRRPGVETMMQRDVALMTMLAKLAKLIPSMRGMPVDSMLAQISAAILQQLDLDQEARSLQELRRNFVEQTWVKVPEPLYDHSSTSVIAMEFIPGLATSEAPAPPPANGLGAAGNVMRAVYEMIFIDGLVHCDLHPGNLHVRDDGTLVMLDAGFVVHLPEVVRRSFADFFINMATGNGPLCAEIILESAPDVPADTDLAVFKSEVSALVASANGSRSGDFNMAEFGVALLSLQQRHSVYPALEFVFPLLSLLVVEGMVKSLDTSLDFQAVAVEVLRRRNLPRNNHPIAN